MNTYSIVLNKKVVAKKVSSKEVKEWITCINNNPRLAVNGFLIIEDHKVNELLEVLESM